MFSGSSLHFESMANPQMDHGLNYWAPLIQVMPSCPWVVFLWLPADMPLSLAADLAMLPYTVPAQFICGDFEKEERRRRHQR